jgi:hypothetical protein
MSKSVVKCYVPSKKCLLDAVCYVLCVLFPERPSDFPLLLLRTVSERP